MSRTGPIAQDWEPVVVRKKLPNAAAKKDEKAVNAARRAGVDIDIAKKRTRPPAPELSNPFLGVEINRSMRWWIWFGRVVPSRPRVGAGFSPDWRAIIPILGRWIVSP